MEINALSAVALSYKIMKEFKGQIEIKDLKSVFDCIISNQEYLKNKASSESIIIHPNKENGLIRSLVVTPKGDFFLLLNRYQKKNDSIVGVGATKRVSYAIHLNTGEKYVSLRASDMHDYEIHQNKTTLLINDKIKNLKFCNSIKQETVQYTSIKDGADKIRMFAKYRNGGDLRKKIQSGTLSNREKKKIIKQLIMAIAELHEGGLAHRDIKPANILLDQNDQAIVTQIYFTDFDGAGTPGKVGDQPLDGLVSTELYSAPEVRENHNGYLNQEKPADIYSLGVTFLALFLPHEELEDSNRLRLVDKISDDFAFEKELIKMMLQESPTSRISAKSLKERVLSNQTKVKRALVPFNTMLTNLGNDLSILLEKSKSKIIDFSIKSFFSSTINQLFKSKKRISDPYYLEKLSEKINYNNDLIKNLSFQY